MLFHCLAEELVELLTEEEPKVAFDLKTSSKDDVEPAPVQTTVTSSPTSATKTAAAALALSGGKKRFIGIKPFGPASHVGVHCANTINTKLYTHMNPSGAATADQRSHCPHCTPSIDLYTRIEVTLAVKRARTAYAQTSLHVSIQDNINVGVHCANTINTKLYTHMNPSGAATADQRSHCPHRNEV